MQKKKVCTLIRVCYRFVCRQLCQMIQIIASFHYQRMDMSCGIRTKHKFNMPHANEFKLRPGGVNSSEPLACMCAASEDILFHSSYAGHSTCFDLPISIYTAADKARAADVIRHTCSCFIASRSIYTFAQVPENS